jgi:PKD repeat protein
MNAVSHVRGWRGRWYGPSQYLTSPSTSGLARWRLTQTVAALGLALGCIISPPMRGDDFLSPPGCRWGVLLLTNALPRAILTTPEGYVIGGLISPGPPLVTEAAFLARVTHEGALTRWGTFTHDSPLSGGWNLGAIAAVAEDTTWPAGYLFTGSVPILFHDGLKEWAAESLWVVRTDGEFNRLWQYKGNDSYGHVGTAIVPHGAGFLIAAATDVEINVGPLDAFDWGSGRGQLTHFHAEAGARLWTRGGFGGAAALESPPIWSMVAGSGDSLLLGTRYGLKQLTRTGDLEWSGGEFLPYVTVLPIPGGGSLGVGNRRERPPDPLGQAPADIVLTRLDAAGETVWTTGFGVPDSNDFARHMIPTADGGSLILGSTGMYGPDRGGTWLIRTDAAGRNLWDLALRGIGRRVAAMPDGDFLVVGEARVEYQWRLWVVKVRGDLQAPIPAFVYSPESPVFIDVEITFDASASTAPGSTLTAWDWDFGDGTTGTGTVVRHRYTMPGLYTVRLTVENAEGVVRSVEQTLEVQGFGVQWERVYGEHNQDQLYALVEAADGGFLMTGAKYTAVGNTVVLWLVRTDSRGRVQWQRALKDEVGQGARGISLVRASEGGYVIAGERRTTIWQTGSDGWVIKVDEDGEIEWTQRFVGDEAERLLSVAALPAGGYLLTGRMESFCPVNGDVWWGHLAADGSVIATNIITVAPAYPRSGLCITPTPDGGSVMTTTGPWPYVSPDTPFNISGGYFAVTKLDASGAAEWNTLLSAGHHQSSAVWAAPAGDGGYYAAGQLQGDGCLIRFDASGQPTRTNLWGAPARSEAVYGAVLTRDDGVLVVGGLAWPPEQYRTDLFVARVDASGREQWRQLFGQPDKSEAGKTLVELADGSLVILGQLDLGSQDWRPWLFKLGPNQPPTGRFICVTPHPLSGTPVRFEVRDAADPDGEIVGFEWDFGDGAFGTGSPGEHVFARAGTFAVTLTVGDDRGGEGRHTESVTVEPAILTPTPGVTIGAHILLDDPAAHPELVDLADAPAGLEWEDAMAFSLAATGPDGPCVFRITFSNPVPEGATLFKLPEWTVVPYARIDERTIEIELSIRDGELDPWFVLAVLEPELRLLGFAHSSPDRLSLRFHGLNGRIYSVEWTAHLPATEWLPVPFALAPDEPCTLEDLTGAGQDQTVYLETPAAVQAYYRLRAAGLQ